MPNDIVEEIEDDVKSVWNKIKGFFVKELPIVESLLAPVVNDLKPILENAGGAILSAGLAAVTASPPAALTLTAVEATLVAAGRAIAAKADTEATPITEQGALALASALHLGNAQAVAADPATSTNNG